MEAHTPRPDNSWDDLEQTIRKEYPGLSGKALEDEIAKDAELLKRLQQKTGKTRKEIFDWLSIMG